MGKLGIESTISSRLLVGEDHSLIEIPQVNDLMQAVQQLAEVIYAQFYAP